MKLEPRLEKLITIMLENDFELVSYGLSPNPNGFCYEYHGQEKNRSKRVETFINKELDSLTKKEEEILKGTML